MQRFAGGVILLFLYATNISGQQEQSAEVRLMNDVFGGRKQNVRPVKNASDTIMVTVEVLLTQIVELDSKHQMLISQVWIRLFWNNPFLVWDPRKYEGIDMLTVKPSEIWIPDITVYNMVGEKHEKSLFNALDTNIMVMSDGQIKWLAPAVLKTDCSIDIDYFPFDNQRCPIKIASWIHDTRYIDFQFKNRNSTNADTASYRENSEWRLIAVTTERSLEQFGCCPAPFRSLTCTVNVRRRASYYIINIILPCGIIAVLSLISFLLPPDSGERVSLVITILLAMSFYMTIISDKMPPNSEGVPLISVFFMSVMAQIALVLVVTCCIIAFHYNKGPVPVFVAFYVNVKLARLVGLRKWDLGSVKPSELKTVEQARVEEKSNTNLVVVQDLELTNNTIGGTAGEFHKKTVATVEKQNSLDHPRGTEEVEEENMEKWPFAARVLNRAFLIFFICSSLISSCIIFFRIPRLSPS